MNKELEKLNHVKLIKKYPSAYDAIKAVYDNYGMGKELWMSKKGIIEVIKGNDILHELDERDILYLLDFFGLCCYVLPERDGEDVVFSGMILRPDMKHQEVCRGKKDRKEVEQLFVLQGMKTLNELLISGVITYKKFD